MGIWTWLVWIAVSNSTLVCVNGLADGVEKSGTEALVDTGEPADAGADTENDSGYWHDCTAASVEYFDL
jgi:hypothetical protein